MGGPGNQDQWHVEIIRSYRIVSAQVPTSCDGRSWPDSRHPGHTHLGAVDGICHAGRSLRRHSGAVSASCYLTGHKLGKTMSRDVGRLYLHDGVSNSEIISTVRVSCDHPLTDCGLTQTVLVHSLYIRHLPGRIISHGWAHCWAHCSNNESKCPQAESRGAGSYHCGRARKQR